MIDGFGGAETPMALTPSDFRHRRLLTRGEAVKVSEVVLIVLVVALAAMTVVWFQPPGTDSEDRESEERSTNGAERE